MTPRRAYLRARTREIHARLDNSLGDLTGMEDYRAYMAMTWRFRRATEPAMAGAAPANGRYRPTTILDEAEQDCRDLCLSVSSRTRSHGGPAGPDEWFGAAYVLEGAGFGARVLAGQAARLGLGPLHGARHLHRLADASDNWTTFLSELEEEDRRIDLDRAAMEASRLFALAIDCIERRKLAGQC